MTQMNLFAEGSRRSKRSKLSKLGDNLEKLNAVIEAINGWIKAELFTDLHITGERPIAEEIADYMRFFNEERPSYALEYLTPKQFKELHGGTQRIGNGSEKLAQARQRGKPESGEYR